MSMTRAYVITTRAIEIERSRAGGDPSKMEVARILAIEELDLRPVGRRDVKLKILAASAEHNVAHAALADTVDIVKARGGKLYPGNSAIGEVIQTGSEAQGVQVGDIVQTHCSGKQDQYGYPLRIWAYDMPDSIGWYAEEAVVEDWQVTRLPLDCGLSLWELAALPLRAPTAYHLWRRALGMYRLKVSTAERAVLNVLSFGGGVGELFLMLAKASGHAAYFCSGSPRRRATLEKQGIVGIDQAEFHRFASETDVEAFRRTCKRLTADEGMHIVCDMLRGSVFAAGLAIASRQGVNASAGWQLSKEVTYDSALLSVRQITLDHVHYETLEGCAAATQLYGKVFRPAIHDELYPFEDLPRCFAEMHQNAQNGIPIVRVARSLPDSVKRIA